MKSKATMDGVVVRIQRNAVDVRLDNNHQVRAVLAGRLMMNRIWLVAADRVRCALTEYDISRARIVKRY
jgi:translation initiation factor IF-1